MYRIQPDLRFPRFKEPWKKTVLGDISKRPMYGVGASAVEFNNKDVYVRITDIEDKSRKLMSRNFTSPSIVNEKYLLKDKDILFARTGASTGKTYIHENYEMKYDYYFAGFLIKFEILKSYYPDFVYQYTLTNFYENWIKVMSVRSGQPGINSEEYSKLKLNIPRYEEQKKIGDFFSKLDRQIELEEQKLEKLEEQKKGYMQQVFSQELRFQDENSNDYPDWESKKISEIVYIIDGDRGKNYPGENDFSENGDTLFLDTGNVTKNGFSFRKKRYISKEKDEKLRSGKLVLNDFVITSRGTLGNLGYYSKTIENAYPSVRINSAMLILRTKKNSNIKSSYLLALLKGNVIKKFMSTNHVGSAQPHITKKDFGNIIIKIPISINEQKVIGDFFNKLDNIIENQSNKIKLLKERKKGFLQKMFV